MLLPGLATPPAVHWLARSCWSVGLTGPALEAIKFFGKCRNSQGKSAQLAKGDIRDLTIHDDLDSRQRPLQTRNSGNQKGYPGFDTIYEQLYNVFHVNLYNLLAYKWLQTWLQQQCNSKVARIKWFNKSNTFFFFFFSEKDHIRAIVLFFQ